MIFLKLVFYLYFGAERLEFPAAAFVKTAEHFVVFQTEYLDTYDQALHTAYKQVSENDTIQLGFRFCACKHEYDFHHGCVADCESSDTHEGKCIGEVAQDNFKQFKNTLYENMPFSFGITSAFFSTRFVSGSFRKRSEAAVNRT